MSVHRTIVNGGFDGEIEIACRDCEWLMFLGTGDVDAIDLWRHCCDHVRNAWRLEQSQEEPRG